MLAAVGGLLLVAVACDYVLAEPFFPHVIRQRIYATKNLMEGPEWGAGLRPQRLAKKRNIPYDFMPGKRSLPFGSMPGKRAMPRMLRKRALPRMLRSMPRFFRRPTTAARPQYKGYNFHLLNWNDM